MSLNMSKTLFEKLSDKGFFPAQVAEVGVYHPETSNIYQYILNGVNCILVEPDPESIGLIKSNFSGFGNIVLHEVAVSDFNGQIELVQRNASTFISTLNNTPAIINDNYTITDNDKIVVESRTFEKIDDGTIDLLSADIEGSEWYVIKYMISRPAVISLETHGAIYINPFIDQILNWMKNNNYEIWYKTSSDTVFVKKNSIIVSAWDKFKLINVNFYLFLKRQRKRLKKKLLHS